MTNSETQDKVTKEDLQRYLAYWSRIAWSAFDVPLKLEAWKRVDDAEKELALILAEQKEPTE